MAITFYLTDAGKQAVIDQANLGIKLNLLNVVLGTGRYNASSNASSMTALQNQVFQSKLSGGSTDSTSGQLRLIAYIDSTITTDIYEVGIVDSNGVLFAVASTELSDPIMRLANNVTSVATFSLKFASIDVGNIVVTADNNSPLSVSLMAKHVANADPHPQYLTRADFSTYINTTTPKIIACGTIAGGSNTIDLSATAIDDFRSSRYTVVITPENSSQSWNIQRNQKQMVIDLQSEGGGGYSGNIGWVILQAYADDAPSGNGIYTSAGTYTIPVLAGEQKLFQVAGGGGGAGISANSSNSSTILVNGSDGSDTTIVMGTTQILKAGGGKGAQGGLWTSATTYQNGVGGAGGTVTAYDGFTVNESKAGNAGRASKDTQSGGVSVSSEGSYGAGGNGQTGIGDEGLAFGGGGGSGAYASIYYRNTTTSTQYITVTVGSAGTGQVSSCNGSTGYARVQTVA